MLWEFFEKYLFKRLYNDYQWKIIIIVSNKQSMEQAEYI